tara:strand:+ start:305 stop:625 length:321 start_codon:yes stop_codon:yes gene_type:complete
MIDKTRISGVTSTTRSFSFDVCPRRTFTHPNELRTILVDQGENVVPLPTPTPQTPEHEGELIVYYINEAGVRAAQVWAAIDINGTLEWKECEMGYKIRNPETGQPV